MAMARTMATRMTTRICCLSGFFAHFDGTHLPVRRWEEGKPLYNLEKQEQQEPPLRSGGGGGIQQDDRPAYSPPYNYGPFYYTPYEQCEESKPLYYLEKKQEQQESPPLPSGGIQDDDDGIRYYDRTAHNYTYFEKIQKDRPAYSYSYPGGIQYDRPCGIQDDRPAYDGPGSYYGGGGIRYYGGGIQDDRPAYYDGPGSYYGGGGIRYYGGGIQDDRSAYSYSYPRGIQDDRPAYSHPSYYDGPGSYYYGGGIQDDRPAFSYPSYPGGIQCDRPEDRPAYSYHDGIQYDRPCGIQDDRPAHSPPPSTHSKISTHPSQKYIDMGLLRPWSLKFSEGGIRADGTPAQRWWEVKFKKPWRLPPSGTPGIQFDDRPAPQLSMVGSNSNWEGRLKRWELGSLICHSLEDVVAHRVYSIAMYFKIPTSQDSVTIPVLEQFEYWLDEVQGYSEFMELAHELHSIRCLYPLLHYVLVYPHAAFRAKTAELVNTMVHNNPRSQQLVLELDGLDPLLYNFMLDPDATSRIKALGAISALIRNNKPGITAFRETYGYTALGDALTSGNVWLQREALNLIQYLLHENSSDCNTVTELGLTCIMMHLTSSDDAEVRVAALGGLLVLARDEGGNRDEDDEGGNRDEDDEGGNSCQLVKNDDKLKQVLHELMKRISAMAPEDLVAAREEIQLVDSLWNACYNEPSPIAWAAVDRKLSIETLLV